MICGPKKTCGAVTNSVSTVDWSISMSRVKFEKLRPALLSSQLVKLTAL